jgi:hypothetical protein
VRSTVPFFVALLSLTSCAAVHVKSVDPADTLREFRQDILSSDKFSPVTLQALRAVGLTSRQVLEEGVTEAEKNQFEQFADDVDRRYIESEVSIGRAQLLERKQPEKAVALYLHAADMAFQGMFLKECGQPVDQRCDSFKVFYDRATRGLLAYMQKASWDSAAFGSFETGIGRTFSLSLAADSKLENPREYTSIEPAASVGLEGLTNRYRRSGLGVSLVACRPRRDASRAEMYLPRVGVCLPLTAVVRFPDGGCSGARCDAKLEIIDSIQSDTYSANGVTVPLAADFTAPLAALVDKTGMSGWDGLFDAIQGNEELLKNTGFYSTEPARADKIPLITVHGLFSNPLTWLDVHNELMGDPVIRKHFQVWHYLYPTSLPILENAKTYREKLDELHAYLTAANEKGAQPPSMVIVAHSMGGILTRTAVALNSTPLQNVYFEDPEKVKTLDPKVQAMLRAYLDFKRKPYIDRVIFVAVPHRGSDIADNWVGRIGRALLSLPKTVLQKTVSVAREARNLLRPDLRSEFDRGDPSSIRGLSAKNPTLIGIADTTIDPHVTYHSIIGDQGLNNTPDSSDGVVKYSSSHLDGAASELIVPADHTAHAHPQAVLEIRRILRLYVEGKK